MTELAVVVDEVRVLVRMNRTSCGPFAHVLLRFEPPGPDGGLELLSVVPEERLPGEFLPALREGLLAGLDGVAAGVLVTDGTYHEVDSSEFGYRIAGREAGLAALIGAGLVPRTEARRLRWTTWPGAPRRR
ncbi:hypothetical protein RM844_31230 [Streptomyces sp. DSM 44915]|uniref:Translation elongation factor EFG/EF2 domain-containing protein n=1 Tax=Streptomyces chisholmiae TaxID=3075540 RepID=A0ABU2K0G8_9ACTN|nr:hypothetical protein [Streptomyces sp. DSM 44915]MDT0270751.1 hypothetical protein [Streptomyces sp. DSM 44915]